MGKIRISSRAWHLRFARNVFNLGSRYKPSNLCSYFWLVIGALLVRFLTILSAPFTILWPGLAFLVYKSDNWSNVPLYRRAEVHLVSGLVTVMVYVVVWAFIVTTKAAPNSDILWINPSDRLDALMRVALFLYASQALLFGLYLLQKKFQRNKFRAATKDSKLTSTFGLVLEFVKAKKAKVCPLIEVVNDNKK